MKSELETLQLQVRALERKFRYLMVGCVALTAFAGWMALRGNVHADSIPQALTVKRLAVVDDKGVERVVITAPLPDPIVQGKRGKRDGVMSGILIYDAKGNERGGFTTSDEPKSLGATLGLDSEDGQVFMAYANASAKDGATVSIASTKNDAVILTTYEQPRIQMVQSGKVIQKIPETAPDVR